MVVVDVVPSEIAGWADVVLPESVYLERYDDFNTEAFREPFVSLRQPVMEAPADQRPNWWIARELAGKLGLGAFYPWTNVEEYLEARLAGTGLTLAEMKKKGVVVGPHRPINVEEGHALEFPTPSGKVEFWSTQLAEKGFDAVPKYTPARRAAGRLLPPALRPRSGPHLLPHPDESAAARGDAGERGLGPCRRRPPLGARERQAPCGW